MHALGRPLPRLLLLLRHGASARTRAGHRPPPAARTYSLSAGPPPPPPPGEPVLHVTVPAPHTGQMHIVLLNTPGTRNALSTGVVRKLQEQVSSLATATAAPRALVLASTNPTLAFCAGADLKERAGMSTAETAAFLASLRGVLADIEALETPTIAAINGPALGGGLELGLACDFRVVGGGHHVQLGLPETSRLGIIPGAGGTFRLARLVGQHTALDIVLTGRRIGGLEAHRLGLATRYVAEQPAPAPALPQQLDDALLRSSLPASALDNVLVAAVALAWDMCTGAPLAVRAAKRAVRGFRAGQDAENTEYDTVVRTRDRDEALQAFRQKRAPVFKGE